MGFVRRFGVKIAWAPVAAVAAVGALLAGSMFASAAAPSLPKKTAAQLLAAMAHAKLPPAMTAVLSESADLGFPALPSIAGMPPSALSAASWLAGSHTAQIWYSGPQQVRIAVPVPFGETDLRVNGSQVWLWQSQGQVATRFILSPTAAGSAGGTMWRFTGSGEPIQGVRLWSLRAYPKGASGARARLGRIYLPGMPAQMHFQSACPMPVNQGNNGGWFINVNGSPPGQQPVRVQPAGAGVTSGLTPLGAARRVLALAGPTTKVTVVGTVTVAGRPAYQLSIAPRSSQSLVGQILIAVDAGSYLPLQVQVLPRGSASPAFQIGFTSLVLGQPAASNFAFTPPPGAHVKVVTLPSTLAGFMGTGGLPGTLPGQVVVPRNMPPGVHLPLGHVRAVKRGGRILEVGPTGPVTCVPVVWSGSTPAQFVAPLASSQATSRVIGSGWLSVVAIPAGAGQLLATVRTMLNSATAVHGSWGSGKLISTRLVNILITDQGQILIGAVTPAVLYADAAQVK